MSKLRRRCDNGCTLFVFASLGCACPPPLQVNEAVNDLLIDEEDFEGLKSSIASFDNFDQVRRDTVACNCLRTLSRRCTQGSGDAMLGRFRTWLW